MSVSKVGLGYTPLQPVKILGQRKNKQSVVQHISAEETDESEKEDDPPSKRTSVFDRLQSSSSTRRPSVFTRIGAQPKPSVFNRIKKGIEPSTTSSQKFKGSVFNRLGDTNEV